MVTVEGIRFWIMDRTPSDNPLEGDLMFTDAEILQAMTHAAREYNSLPPLVHCVDPYCLPDDTNIFFEATAEMLYKMTLHKLRRNAFEYAGGSVKVNEDTVKIDGIQKMLDEVKQWRAAAQNLEQQLNVNTFYCSYGS